jgi:peptide/nickel transport system substrate-binding protein
MKNKKIHRASLAWIIVLLLTACSIGQEPPANNQPPTKQAAKEGGTLIIARMSDAANLDPHFISTINAASVVHQKVYEGLVKRDPNMEIQPSLATAWKQLDAVTWEFSLRSGVVFHDGTPLDAEAVKKTFDRVLDPKTASPRATMFGKIKEVKAVDPHTVRFSLTEPYTPLLSILASHEGGILSPRAIDQYGKELSKHPVGTGPFKFQSWNTGLEIVLKKNPQYWGEPPKIDQVIFRVVPDDLTRIDMVERGEAHIAESKANSPIGPKVFGYSPTVKAYPYDLNKARELLAEAGYPNGFQTTILTYDRKDRVRLAQVIRSQLKGIGIDAELNILGYAEFVEVIEKTKQHEIFVSGWGNATGDADYNQYNLFHTVGGSAGNSFMYSNLVLDQLIEAGRKEKDPNRRKEIYAKAQELEMENALLVPIRNLENLAVVSKNIQGFSISPAGYLMIHNVAIE